MLPSHLRFLKRSRELGSSTAVVIIFLWANNITVAGDVLNPETDSAVGIGWAGQKNMPQGMYI